MSDSKYSAQMKHLADNYVQFPLRLKPEVLNAYKAACMKNNTTPTTEIKRFVNEYISQNKPLDMEKVKDEKQKEEES